MSGWRVAAASAIGTSHIAAGSRCQDVSDVDAFAAQTEDILTLVVSDGAGSALHAERGAACAVAAVKDAVRSYFDGGGTFAGLTRETANAWLDQVQAALRSEAARVEAPLAEFACTLLLAVIGSDHAAFFQLGDGAIVASDGLDDGFSYVFWPQHGEFANTTNFVVASDATEAFEFALQRRPDLQEIAIFSDGLENLVLHYASRTVHQAFFAAMFKPVRACRSLEDSAGLGADLATYLNSPGVTNRTDDDKSLILATRIANKDEPSEDDPNQDDPASLILASAIQEG
jgi:hypothetical protein